MCNDYRALFWKKITNCFLESRRKGTKDKVAENKQDKIIQDKQDSNLTHSSQLHLHTWEIHSSNLIQQINVSAIIKYHICIKVVALDSVDLIWCLVFYHISLILWACTELCIQYYVKTNMLAELNMAFSVLEKIINSCMCSICKAWPQKDTWQLLILRIQNRIFPPQEIWQS